MLDMDSMAIRPTHGDQEGAAWNGHFACTRCLCSTGSAMRQFGVLQPVVERYRERDLRRFFQGDAACAAPDIHEFPEAEGDRYTIRLKADAILRQSIACLPTRPVGRPTRSHDPHPCRLQPSGRVMGQEASGRRQGRTASGRTYPVRRLHRHQAEPPCRARGRLLQPARPGRYTSRKAGTRLCGPGCHAGGSGTLPCGSGFMHSPAIPVTSCGRQVCRRRSGDGRRPV